MKEVTLKQYNKIMDKIIKLEDKVEIQDKLILMLEEAAKCIIVDQNIMVKKGKNAKKSKSRKV